MKNLEIHINPDLIYYPIISFNYETGICEISGESYMEETYKFYEPVINWIKEYCEGNKPITLNIKLTYFNTSSSRFILEILDTLKNYQKTGAVVTINWFYTADDPDIITEISDFMEETGTQINMFTIE